MNKDCLRVIPLGGLCEIGKSITAFEYADEIVVIDCGIAFPDDEMYGVDLVVPDVTYLKENINKIRGFFITHGHEDHIGALPYVLKDINVPVYGTKLTIGMINNKLKEHRIDSICNLNCVEAGDIIHLDKLDVEFIRNTHSIADSCSIAIHTPLGIIIHTGDFKLDHTPIDGFPMDLRRIGELGSEGVLLLMSDSTNVERNGYSMSEKSIGYKLGSIFAKASGRIIVSTFASNIHRIQQIANSSIEHGRKIAFSGRSMENTTGVARELGYLHLDDDSLISLDDISRYKPSEVTIITTGSQGEPMAALARIAYANHKKIKIERNDLFIISASPIPGNDKLIGKVIDQLYKKGADVIYKALEDIHVSGHAYREELKIIHNLVNAKYFMPIHGEYRHLKHHVDMAQELGMDRENIFLLELGDLLKINLAGAKLIKGGVKTGKRFLDGFGALDAGNVILRDRRMLAEEGMLTIVAVIDVNNYTIVSGPDIITRGFVYVKESEELIRDARFIAKKELEECLDNKIVEWYVLKATIRSEVGKYLYLKTRRRPNVITMIMEI